MKSRVKLKCKIRVHVLTIFRFSSPDLLFRDKGRNTAKITCRVCLEDFQTGINFLSEPIDVYNDWVDACETAN